MKLIKEAVSLKTKSKKMPILTVVTDDILKFYKENTFDKGEQVGTEYFIKYQTGYYEGTNYIEKHYKVEIVSQDYYQLIDYLDKRYNRDDDQ